MNEEAIKLVDDHIALHEVKPLAKVVDFASVPQAQLINIATLAAKLCGYYATAKPAIDFAVKYLLFWRAKWQTIIRNVQKGVEDVCAVVSPVE